MRGVLWRVRCVRSRYKRQASANGNSERLLGRRGLGLFLRTPGGSERAALGHSRCRRGLLILHKAYENREGQTEETVRFFSRQTASDFS
jgi:hypothetical protein